MSTADQAQAGLIAQQREFIHALLSAFSLAVDEGGISTLPRCNNNFVHFVTFGSPLLSEAVASTSPGTSPIPAGTTRAVLRIGNPAAMFNHAVKVENTVAAMQIARQATAKLNIVPLVYAWSKDGGPSDNGWILEQHIPGVDLEADFHLKFSPQEQQHVLAQLAEVLKMVQDFELPPAASGYGGLKFDHQGQVVNGPFVVEPYAGPYPDMASLYKDMLRLQLVDADKSPAAKGWHENGLRERLDAFAANGLDNVLARTLGGPVKTNLIIGDIVIANLLFDPTTHRLIGLVDFDCSHTGHPLHEYFFSSFSLSYCIAGAKPDVMAALCHGFPSPLPETSRPWKPAYEDNDVPQWPAMAFFEEELATASVKRPRTVQGTQEIAKVYSFLTEVCPFHYNMERWLVKQTDESLQKSRACIAKTIEGSLAEWGY